MATGSKIKGIHLNYKPFSYFHQAGAKALFLQGFLGTSPQRILSKSSGHGEA
jgi:hypothetical protein